jgi:PST family polysaccharide transporter
MYGTITGAVGNIILNIILIPTMGAKGAVWATIITQMIASFLSSFIFKKTRKLAVIQLHSLFPFVRMVKLFGKYIRRRKNGINNNSSL